MTDRQIIHSMGDRFRWQLAVVGSDVTTSRHLPTSDGSTYYTTADFGLTTRDAGEDGLSPYQVVARYHDRAADAPAFPELLEATRAALRGETPEATESTREASAV